MAHQSMMPSDDTVLLRINGDGNIVANHIAAQAITFVACLVAVGLRFWSRRLSKAQLWWDDWLIVPALLVNTACIGISVAWFYYGGSKYIGDVTIRKLRGILIAIFTTELAYCLGMLFVRTSTLMLWQRLFTQRWARMYSWFWFAMSCAWSLSIFIITFLQCKPLSGFWNRMSHDYRCDVDTKKFYLDTSIVGIVIDLAIIILPLVMCLRLQLSATLKVLITGIFATSLFATIISGVRCVAVLQADLNGLQGINASWTFASTGIWSITEMNLAVVASCLPVLRPILAKMVPAALVPRSLKRSKYHIPYSIRKPGNKRARVPEDPESGVMKTISEHDTVDTVELSSRSDSRDGLSSAENVPAHHASRAMWNPT